MANGHVSVGLGLTFSSQTAERCEVEQGLSLAGGLAWEPRATNYVIDIGLDRQSFLDRGFSEESLGRWNGGSHSERRGVFLSMFYALQNKNPNEPNHPWNEEVHDWDRGLGAHLDYWRQSLHQKPYYLYAYDHPNPPTRRGVITARRSDEWPFKEKKAGVAGTYFANSDQIYIKSDYSSGWACGHRFDEGDLILGEDRKYRYNLTFIIAHEVGHFFGFDHVADKNALMHPNVLRWWQTPKTDEMFRTVAGKITGP